MKKNLVVMAAMALSMSMVLTSPAYAGVVKKNATGAAAKAVEEQSKVDEKKENETQQVSSETSSQGQGDQTEQAHAGLKDQSPTEQAKQPQKEIGRKNGHRVVPTNLLLRLF